MHREQGHVRPAAPGRRKRGPTRQQGEYGRGRPLIDHQAQPFQGRGIAPVQVFHDREARAVARRALRGARPGFPGCVAAAVAGSVGVPGSAPLGGADSGALPPGAGSPGGRAEPGARSPPGAPAAPTQASRRRLVYSAATTR